MQLRLTSTLLELMPWEIWGESPMTKTRDFPVNPILSSSLEFHPGCGYGDGL